MSALAVESTTSALPDADLATLADVSLEAVVAFRSGTPHWVLERPGVMLNLATATGADLGEIRANFRKAKNSILNSRGHGSSGPASFPGQTWPNFNA